MNETNGFPGEHVKRIRQEEIDARRRRRISEIAIATALAGGAIYHVATKDEQPTRSFTTDTNSDENNENKEDEDIDFPTDTISRDFKNSLKDSLPERRRNQLKKFKLITEAINGRINSGTFKGDREEDKRRYFFRLYNNLDYRKSILLQIKAVAALHRIPVDILSATIALESGFETKAESKKGAYGLVQLMPNTKEEAEKMLGRKIDPKDIMDNLEAGAVILNKYYKMFGDWGLARVAYAVGPSHLSRFLNKICPEFKLFNKNELDVKSRELLRKKMNSGEITLPDLYDMSPEMFQHAFLLSVITKPTLFYLQDKENHKPSTPPAVGNNSKFAEAKKYPFVPSSIKPKVTNIQVGKNLPPPRRAR